MPLGIRVERPGCVAGIVTNLCTQLITCDGSGRGNVSLWHMFIVLPNAKLFVLSQKHTH